MGRILTGRVFQGPGEGVTTGTSNWRVRSPRPRKEEIQGATLTQHRRNLSPSLRMD